VNMHGRERTVVLEAAARLAVHAAQMDQLQRQTAAAQPMAAALMSAHR
jgi:hypothetical protein